MKIFVIIKTFFIRKKSFSKYKKIYIILNTKNSKVYGIFLVSIQKKIIMRYRPVDK